MIKKSVLDDRHTLITSAHYPYWQSQDLVAKRGSGTHKAVVGIGGNIGDTVRRFERLYWFLKHSRSVVLLQSAPILRNPPFGFLEQADFYNSIVLLGTSLTPRALLHYLLRVEKRFGRKRSIKDGPRTLDLDILFYDDIVINTKELTIPHPGWISRDSVLIPLQYMKGKR